MHHAARSAKPIGSIQNPTDRQEAEQPAKRFRSLYVGDPVSGIGMAAMTNGDKGEEVCNALRQRVATAYGWR